MKAKPGSGSNYDSKMKRMVRSSLGKTIKGKFSSNPGWAEGPKRSVKGPVRGGPATGKGKPANKRKK